MSTQNLESSRQDKTSRVGTVLGWGIGTGSHLVPPRNARLTVLVIRLFQHRRVCWSLAVPVSLASNPGPRWMKKRNEDSLIRVKGAV